MAYNMRDDIKEVYFTEEHAALKCNVSSFSFIKIVLKIKTN